MGRKQKNLTTEQAAEVETLSAVLSQDQIADYFGMHRNTFGAILARDEAVAEAHRRGKAKAIGMVARSLLQAALKGDRVCQMFYLKTQAGWRETNSLELSGPNGGPIQAEDVTRDADAFASRMARLAAAAASSGDGASDAGSEGGA